MKYESQEPPQFCSSQFTHRARGILQDDFNMCEKDIDATNCRDIYMHLVQSL